MFGLIKIRVRKDCYRKLNTFLGKFDSHHCLRSILVIYGTSLEHFKNVFVPYISYIETGVRQSFSIIEIRKIAKFVFVATHMLRIN